VADKTGALNVAQAVLAGLFEQARSGVGQAVEVPMFESAVAYVMVEHLYGETFVPPLDTAGYKRILNKYRRPFQTKDGYLAVLPYTDADWQAFFRIANRPELAADARFKTFQTRLSNVELLYGQLADIVATRTSAEWLADLDRANIPATVVNSLETLFTDPQLEATGFWKIVEHPSEGTLRMPDIPSTYSRTPGEIRRLPPRLGEHSLEILREANFSAAEIAAMLASGATAGERDRGAS
jgi:crotonobetainyl-CoA:carnitine CoA-transferase CaiB-like acyl-CoA transferase